ncbi:hypothetical protein [Ferrovibrio sp.]|uniref:hypothetical protein n=1 Tax=Ferrovibrio sp. TaxID=1917215 RepID=UPI0035B14C1C
MADIRIIEASETAKGLGGGFRAGRAGQAGDAAGDAGRADDIVIDVEAEEIGPDTDRRPGFSAGRKPALAACFNTETDFHGQSLGQLAVRSLSIVDYVRGLGQTEMADGDLDSLVRCADDLESAIILMFQLAGGTRMELRQRYEAMQMAIFAQATGQSAGAMNRDVGQDVGRDVHRGVAAGTARGDMDIPPRR